MSILYTPFFRVKFKRCSKETQQKFYKQITYLLRNIRHPSLHAKKYDETKGIWQARVDKNYRFYFRIEKDVYVLLDIKPHPR